MSTSPIECLATRPAALENANLGSAGLSGSLVTPLASHEEGGPRDTAITREQLNAKDNCLAWLIRRRSMLANLILPRV